MCLGAASDREARTGDASHVTLLTLLPWCGVQAWGTEWTACRCAVRPGADPRAGRPRTGSEREGILRGTVPAPWCCSSTAAQDVLPCLSTASSWLLVHIAEVPGGVGDARHLQPELRGCVPRAGCANARHRARLHRHPRARLARDAARPARVCCQVLHARGQLVRVQPRKRAEAPCLSKQCCFQSIGRCGSDVVCAGC